MKKRPFKEKNQLVGRSAGQIRWRWLLVVAGMAIVGALLGLLYYQHYQRHPLTIPLAANAQHNEPPAIRFEFYTALPAMQVSEATVITQGVAAQSIQEVSKPVAPAAVATMPVIPAATSAATVTSVPATPAIVITKLEELEKDLSAAIKNEVSSQQAKSNAYMVQVGVFSSAAAANRYQQRLTAAGFPAAIIQLNKAGKTLYRVQIGPLVNKDRAKIVQQQLLAKGYKGIIRKG